MRLNSKMDPIVITSFTSVNSLGVGVADIERKLAEKKSGLQYCEFPGAELDTFVGQVKGVDELCFNGSLKKFDCRNNRLAKMGLESDNFKENVILAREKYGPSRVSVLIGTSTSGLHEMEKAYIHSNLESIHLPSSFHFKETFNMYSVS